MNVSEFVNCKELQQKLYKYLSQRKYKSTVEPHMPRFFSPPPKGGPGEVHSGRKGVITEVT